MKLIDFAGDIYSQFGEDGIIEHIFDTLELKTGHCVEFGAADGITGSNVRRLWHDKGWKGTLFEADPAVALILKENLTPNATAFQTTVMPTGPTSIDEMIHEPVHFMVIDVDGNDYAIWAAMKMSPTVMCVEFNPTIPPHISIHQNYSDEPYAFGSSLLALIELGEKKHYTFIGATRCNAFFVQDALAKPFFRYERDPLVLFPLTGYAYLITDYDGNALGVGEKPPWGLHLPYTGVPPVPSDQVFEVYDDVREALFPANEKAHVADIYYQAKYQFDNMITLFQPPHVLYPEAKPMLEAYLSCEQYSVISLQVDYVSNPKDLQWIYDMGNQYGYTSRLAGGVILLKKVV